MIYGQGFENLRRELGKQYTLRKIDVSQGSSIEGDVSTLIVAGPQSLYKLMRNTKLIT